MNRNNHGLLLVFFLLAIAGNWMIKPHDPADAEAVPSHSTAPEHNNIMPENVAPARHNQSGLQRLGLGDDPFGIKEKYTRSATPNPDKLQELQKMIKALSAAGGAQILDEQRGPSTAGGTQVPDMAKIQVMTQKMMQMVSGDSADFSQMMRPVDLPMTSDYGMRKDPIRMNALENHNGEDYAMPENTEVPAPSDGVIEYAGDRSGYGLTVEIKHSEKISSLFAHLNEIAVATGQQIQKGQIIGKSGSTGRSTGPHLHYELRVDGKPVNPKVLVMLLTMLAGQQNTGDLYVEQ
jgi:murein DD-endopeptidase MepM/ murein hydrolase activator NlpD